jgi:Methyltransferase domain
VNYASFSTLLRARFDEAQPSFADGSVDLLHIDGLHSYDAVRQDFSNWLPKLSSRAIVLLHDTNVRQQGFGVWQFFEEISCHYATFEFVHSSGLGVISVGTETLPGSLQALFATKGEAEIGRVRAYFARLGLSVLDRYLLHEAEAKVDKLKQERLATKTVLADARDATHRMSRMEKELASLRRQLEKRSKKSARPRFLWLASSLIKRPLRALAARVRAARR